MSSADRGEPVGSQWYRHTWLQRYGGALIAVAAAALLSYGLEIAVGAIPRFILFYPAIMLVALLGGFGPGVFATLRSWLATHIRTSLPDERTWAAADSVGME